MKHPDHLKMRTFLLTCCLAAAYPAAHAEETSTTTTPTTTSTTTASTSTTSTTTTAVGTSTNTEAKLSAEFAEFLGSQEQASAVVSGLRQGTPFSLDAASDTASATGTTGTTGTTSTTSTATTTIDPPTGTMGYGNVRITLRLAQAQLNQMGITQPTTEELSAALLGGDINGTHVDGILTLRADGMGWGQIAREYGMTVGQLMGKGTGLTKQTATATTVSQTKTTGKAAAISSSTTKSGQTSQARSNGYIPSSKSTSASSAHSNGYIPSGSGKSHGAGIVSAAGGSMSGASNGGGKGQAHKITTSGQGAGAVSASGQHVSMGASNAGGGSNAMTPGQAKKN
ncbi:MAG: hypothetical protein ACYCZS_00565 [Thiobacillus sp.]